MSPSIAVGAPDLTPETYRIMCLSRMTDARFSLTSVSPKSSRTKLVQAATRQDLPRVPYGGKPPSLSMISTAILLDMHWLQMSGPSAVQYTRYVFLFVHIYPVQKLIILRDVS